MIFKENVLISKHNILLLSMNGQWSFLIFLIFFLSIIRRKTSLKNVTFLKNLDILKQFFSWLIYIYFITWLLNYFCKSTPAVPEKNCIIIQFRNYMENCSMMENLFEKARNLNTIACNLYLNIEYYDVSK